MNNPPASRRSLKTLTIWHRLRHDDSTVTEVILVNPREYIKSIIRNGGFWSEDEKSFIPLASITYYEITGTSG